MSETLSSFASAFRQLAGRCSACALDRLSDPDFNRLALRLFRLQHAANADYRRWCDSRGVNEALMEDWRAVPAVPTSAFKQSSYSCLPIERRTTVFESSGTTATVRSRHHHSADSLAVYEGSLLPWFQHHLLPEHSGKEDPSARGVSLVGFKRLRFLSLTPAPEAVPRSSLVHMLGCVANQTVFEVTHFAGGVEPDGAWHVRSGNALDILNAGMRDDAPVLLVGTAFNFVQWLGALELGTGPLVLPRGSRVMETGGYKGRTRSLTKADLHAWISRMLAVPRDHIVTEYGMTELCSQGYDRVVGVASSGDYLRFPPWVRALVISLETGHEAANGEPGFLRIFDLANVFSVMAVETEDLAVDEGEGLRLIGRDPAAELRGCSLQSVPFAGTADHALAS